MKLRKLAALTLTVAMSACLAAGCGSTSDNKDKEAGGQASSGQVSGKQYDIGIIQLTEHVALDASNKGFVDGLKELGIDAKFDQQNAQNDQSALDTISSKFVSAKKDLILAIATPAAQSIAGKTTDIPILCTAVTDPAESGLVESNEKPNTNVSGTSDLTPIKEQIELLQKLLPDTKNVGILYCSAEDNSRLQAKIAQEELDKANIGHKDYTVSSSNEIQTVVESMVGEVDVIYCPTDNMIAAGMATVSMVATENKIPCIVGEAGMVEAGGLATYGIDYYNLGKMTAKMAAKILKGEAKPQDMPIEYLQASECELTVNDEVAKTLGIDTSVLDK